MNMKTALKNRIVNGTIVTEIKTGKKLQIISSVNASNGYVYSFVGKDFTLHESEIKPNGW